jgi:hypothetical protein
VKNFSFQFSGGGLHSQVYTSSVILDTTPPTAPVILTPINGSSANNPNPEITWSASIDTGAGLDPSLAYVVSIDTDSDCLSPMYY